MIDEKTAITLLKEKYQALKGIRTHDLCATGAMLLKIYYHKFVCLWLK